MRKGRTTFHQPPFVSDRGVGEFADSGTRKHVRFLATDTSIGAYSLKPAARSKKLNRGAIVKIADSTISYFVTGLSDRKDGISSKKDELYGPALPFSINPGASGEVTVTASMERAVSSNRKAVDDDLLNRDSKGCPFIVPFFWTFKDRLTNWLLLDSGPVFYQVTGETKSAYKALITASQQLNSRGGCYIDHAERAIFGTESNKGNAGASRLLDRNQMQVGPQHAIKFHLNFMPVTFQYGFGHIYFMPDELIIAENSGDCTFVPYSELSYRVLETTHMNVPVPGWCTPVGYTWQYMNKDGGPDRRYSNNVQIPHFKVWELDFTFSSRRIDTAFADDRALNQFTKALDQLISLSSKRKVTS